MSKIEIMNMFIIDNQVFIRLGFFFGIMVSMAVWEIIAPRRALSTSKKNRWFVNLSITVLNALIVRLVFSAAAVGAALFTEEHGWGIFNIFHTGDLASGLIAIVVLDLTIYIQHVLFHHLPLFWRLHMVHHTDLDIDVTTGARFHPIEIVLSMIIKMGIIMILGAPAWSVLIFEVLLNGTSMFNHSNIFIPLPLDRIVRRIVVSPDMHRVHHSVIIRERNSNFGFNFPWWDRLFGTYKDQPSSGHQGMTIGLANFRDANRLTLPYALALPLLRQK